MSCVFSLPIPPPPRSTLFPYTTLFRSIIDPKNANFSGAMINRLWKHFLGVGLVEPVDDLRASNPPSNRELWDYLSHQRSEEHTSELQSRFDLVCRLLLEKKKVFGHLQT